MQSVPGAVMLHTVSARCYKVAGRLCQVLTTLHRWTPYLLCLSLLRVTCKKCNFKKLPMQNVDICNKLAHLICTKAYFNTYPSYRTHTLTHFDSAPQRSNSSFYAKTCADLSSSVHLSSLQFHEKVNAANLL